MSSQFLIQCCCPNFIQSNLSTTVSHGELQKWPLLTGGRCLERQIYPALSVAIRNWVHNLSSIQAKYKCVYGNINCQNCFSIVTFNTRLTFRKTELLWCMFACLHDSYTNTMLILTSLFLFVHANVMLNASSCHFCLSHIQQYNGVDKARWASQLYFLWSTLHKH